ncbi:DUF6850 family outer membrane beta-barrel protein [Chryseobacterium sp. TY4]
MKALYQYNSDKFVIGVTPYFQYQEIMEQRMYPFRWQNFKSYTLGFDALYNQEISNNQVLSFSTNFYSKNILKTTNAISTELHPNILDWLISDYNYLASDVTNYGAKIRYDLKLSKLPAFYVEGAWQQYKMQKKSNNFAQLILGITF